MRGNRIRNLTLGGVIASTALYAGLNAQQAPALYNTVKQKLRDGGQVVGATVLIGNPDTYSAVATPGSISPGLRCSTVP